MELRLDGPINDFSAEMFNFQLDDFIKDENKNEPIDLVISSPGGSVISGWAIYNRLKSLSNPINVRIEGLAASIIALAGDTVKISEVGSFMIHRASTFAEGDQNELEKQIETLKAIDETLITVYQAKTNESRDQIEEWLDEEKWFTPEEAVEVGFASEIINKVDARMAALYLPKSGAMTKLEKLMNFLNMSDEDTETKEETKEETSTKEETKEEEVETKEETDNKEETEVEAITEEQIQAMIDKSLERFDDKLDQILSATKENVETASEGAAELAEAAIKKLLKGVKSDGKVPFTNQTMDGTGYEVPNAKFKERIKAIEEKTRLE